MTEQFQEILSIVIDRQKLKEDANYIVSAYAQLFDQVRRTANQGTKDIVNGNLNFYAGMVDKVGDQYNQMGRIARAAWRQIQADAKAAAQAAIAEKKAEVLAFEQEERRKVQIAKQAAREMAAAQREYAQFKAPVTNQLKALNSQRYADHSAQRLAGRNIAAPTLMEGIASNATVGRGLRAAAGFAGSMGIWQGAAGIYGIEKLASAAGIANTSLTTLTATTYGFGAALAALAAPFMIMHSAAEFNNELAKMSTLMDQASTSSAEFRQNLDSLAAQAADVSIKFNMDLIDTVKAFKEALSSGIGEEDIARFTDIAGTLANSLGVSLTDATNVLTSFKDAYQLQIGDLAHITDVLFNTIDVGKVNVNDLVNNIGRLLPIASAAGVSIQDMMTAVASLTRQGFTSSQAITSVIQVINGIVNPSQKSAKAFHELGLEIGSAALRGKPFVEVVQQIKDATGGDLDLLGNLFSEDRAARGIAALAKGVDLTRQLREQIDVSGTATTAADRAMNTFGNNVDKIWKAISNTFQLVGNDLLNLANDIFFGGPLGVDSLTAVRVAVEEIGIVFKVLGGILMNVLNTTVKLGMALYNLVTLDWGNMVENLKSAAGGWIGMIDSVDKSLNRIEKMVNATEDVNASSVKLNTTFQTVGVSITESLDEGITSAKELEKATKAAAKAAEKLEANYNKIFDKRVDDRATDEQKKQLQDLEDQLTAAEYLHNEAQARIENAGKFARAQGQKNAAGKMEGINTQLRGVAESHYAPFFQILNDDPSHGTQEWERKQQILIEARNKYYVQLVEMTQKELDSELDKIAREAMQAAEAREQQYGYSASGKNIEEIKQKIAALRNEISSQPDKEARKAQEAKNKEIAEEAKKSAHDVMSEYDRLYKEDLSNYDKAQKAKENLTKKFNSAILKIEEDRLNQLADIQAKIFQLKMDKAGARGGKDAESRTARSEKESAQKELEGYVASGGKDPKMLKALQERFENASSAQFGSSDANNRFNTREKDLLYLQDIVNRGADSQKSQKRGDYQRDLAQTRYNLKSEKELSEMAIKNAQITNEVRNVQENIKLDLNVNVKGDLQPPEAAKLAAVLQRYLTLGKDRGKINDFQPKTSFGTAPTNEDADE